MTAWLHEGDWASEGEQEVSVQVRSRASDELLAGCEVQVLHGGRTVWSTVGRADP